MQPAQQMGLALEPGHGCFDVAAVVRAALFGELGEIDLQARVAPEVIENIDVDWLEAHTFQ